MGIIKSFDIENLLPFKKRDGVPDATRPPEEKIADLDPTLNHEEQVYVNHYIGYADQLLGIPPPKPEPIEKRVVEMHARKKADGPSESDGPSKKEERHEVA